LLTRWQGLSFPGVTAKRRLSHRDLTIDHGRHPGINIL
jgi:hypothetical protein